MDLLHMLKGELHSGWRWRRRDTDNHSDDER